MTLLDVIAMHNEPITLKKLSQATGLHSSTVHRILNDMVTCHWVERIEPSAYRLGMRLLELGNIVKARLSVREVAIIAMRELHRITSQTVNLAIKQGDEIVYIERVISENSGMQVVRTIGGRAPLHLTSIGKLYLALEETNRVRNYAMRTGLSGTTRNSITDLVQLENELSKVKSNGWAKDHEELELGVRCIAAAINDDTGRIIAGLSLSAPADRLQETWVTHLCKTAKQISFAMGFKETNCI